MISAVKQVVGAEKQAKSRKNAEKIGISGAERMRYSEKEIRFGVGVAANGQAMMVGGSGSVEHYRLVASKTGCFVDLAIAKTTVIEIAFGSCNER